MRQQRYRSAQLLNMQLQRIAEVEKRVLAKQRIAARSAATARALANTDLPQDEEGNSIALPSFFIHPTARCDYPGCKGGEGTERKEKGNANGDTASEPTDVDKAWTPSAKEPIEAPKREVATTKTVPLGAIVFKDSIANMVLLDKAGRWHQKQQAETEAKKIKLVVVEEGKVEEGEEKVEEGEEKVEENNTGDTNVLEDATGNAKRKRGIDGEEAKEEEGGDDEEEQKEEETGSKRKLAKQSSVKEQPGEVDEMEQDSEGSMEQKAQAKLAAAGLAEVIAKKKQRNTTAYRRCVHHHPAVLPWKKTLQRATRNCAERILAARVLESTATSPTRSVQAVGHQGEQAKLKLEQDLHAHLKTLQTQATDHHHHQHHQHNQQHQQHQHQHQQQQQQHQLPSSAPAAAAWTAATSTLSTVTTAGEGQESPLSQRAGECCFSCKSIWCTPGNSLCLRPHESPAKVPTKNPATDEQTDKGIQEPVTGANPVSGVVTRVTVTSSSSSGTGVSTGQGDSLLTRSSPTASSIPARAVVTSTRILENTRLAQAAKATTSLQRPTVTDRALELVGVDQKDHAGLQRLRNIILMEAKAKVRYRTQ
jgi:hypothetical protein